MALHTKLYGREWVECPEPWEPGYFRLFASHVSTDRVLVGDVRERLRVFGIDTFVAHVDIAPTEEWQAVIEQALKTCHTLAAFLTPNFHESLWTDQEVGFVYGRGVLVLSLMMGRAPYGFLGKTQGLPTTGLTAEEIAERILVTLLKRPELNEKLAEGMLAALEAAESFDEANERIETLRRVARWPRHLAPPLKAAGAFNNQVSGAWRVPHGVNDLVSRMD